MRARQTRLSQVKSRAPPVNLAAPVRLRRAHNERIIWPGPLMRKRRAAPKFPRTPSGGLAKPGLGALLTGAQQGQKAATLVERHQIVATANMGLADEDLRYGALTGNLHHLDALSAVQINPDLFNFNHAAFQEQLFGTNAVWTNGGGVHLDGLHGIDFQADEEREVRKTDTAAGPKNRQDLSTGRLADFQAPMPPPSDDTSV